MPSPLLKGHIEVASAAILFGTIGIFVSLVNRMPIGSIIFYRLLFGIIAIAIFFACCGKSYGEQLPEPLQGSGSETL